MKSSIVLPPEGEPFNGYRKLNSVLIPISLGSVKSINWFDKFLYGRLRFEAGNSDRCRVVLGGREGLAKELSVSEDSVARSIDRLAAARLISRKRSRNQVLIVFLWSQLLDRSLPKAGRPEPAELRVINDTSEPAELRVADYGQEIPEPAELRSQNPQSCGPEPAELRVAYKEFLGFSLRNRKDTAAAQETSELPQTSDEEIAAAAPPLSENETPSGKPPALSAADRKNIAIASSMALCNAPPLAETSSLIDKIWELAFTVGCKSPDALAIFMDENGRASWRSHGIWLKVIPADYAESEGLGNLRSLGLIETKECEKCHHTGIVGHRGELSSWFLNMSHEGKIPELCSCPTGQELQPVYSVGSECRECRGTLRHKSSTLPNPTCSFCSAPITGEESAMLAAEKLGAVVGLSWERRRCRVCYGAGFVKSNGCTVDVSIAYCECGHGEVERRTRGEDWPATETERLQGLERETARLDAEFGRKFPGRQGREIGGSSCTR